METKYILNQHLKNMIQNQLKNRDIVDKNVLDAFLKVPREDFIVLEENKKFAYDDRPLSIGFEVTISQPYIVAKTLQEAKIKKNDKVLEIGTGSGYQTALLSTMGAEVYTIEVIQPLYETTKQLLEKLKYKNIHFHFGNGYEGWPTNEKFDVILLTASPKCVPEKLISQLKVGGRLVGPIGEFQQWLTECTKTEMDYKVKKIIPVQFVPMVE